MTSKTISLQKFITTIKDNGYSPTKMYTLHSNIKYIELCLNLRRKPLLIRIPDNLIVHNNVSNYAMVNDDVNYRNYRQREYLGKITLDQVACVSEKNLCVKSGEDYECYTIEDIDPDIEEPESTDPEPNDYSDSESFEITIDEYPVNNILPVYNLDTFVETEQFEQMVIDDYSLIVDVEEEINELRVQTLIEQFDKQQHQIKDRMYELHSKAYNARRDIEKCSDNLERIYKLKEKTKNENDRTRFKVDRMATETEEKIDNLNEKLAVYRETADSLLGKYTDYITKFSAID